MNISIYMVSNNTICYIATMMYQYFLKIVSSEFNYLNGKHLRTFQYSVSRQERDLKQQAQGGLPGK